MFGKAKRLLQNRPSKADSAASAARSSGSVAAAVPDGLTPTGTQAEGQRILAPSSQGPSQAALRPLAVISLFDGMG
eukprot:8983775-Alexandrium_andersonii.AAC.1